VASTSRTAGRPSPLSNTQGHRRTCSDRHPGPFREKPCTGLARKSLLPGHGFVCLKTDAPKSPRQLSMGPGALLLIPGAKSESVGEIRVQYGHDARAYGRIIGSTGLQSNRPRLRERLNRSDAVRRGYNRTMVDHKTATKTQCGDRPFGTIDVESQSSDRAVNGIGPTVLHSPGWCPPPLFPQGPVVRVLFSSACPHAALLRRQFTDRAKTPPREETQRPAENIGI